uniref:Uncharacterized protein n=1 Tax=Anguilla anguilla TaxID=7936 RepID=A0A0E9TAZ6_ANGAN
MPVFVSEGEISVNLYFNSSHDILYVEEDQYLE